MFDHPQKVFALLGAVFAFLGVAAGAFGAHSLKTKISAEMLSIFEVGVRYQLFHALALFLIAWSVNVFSPGWCIGAGVLLTAGIVLFSGSLYILAISGVRAWGAVTPIGGVLLLLGWLSLIAGIVKS